MGLNNGVEGFTGEVTVLAVVLLAASVLVPMVDVVTTGVAVLVLELVTCEVEEETDVGVKLAPDRNLLTLDKRGVGLTTTGVGSAVCVVADSAVCLAVGAGEGGKSNRTSCFFEESVACDGMEGCLRADVAGFDVLNTATVLGASLTTPLF